MVNSAIFDDDSSLVNFEIAWSVAVDDVGFVELLREAIRESGKTLGELQRDTGIAKGTLSRFVRGGLDGITLNTAERICRAVGLELKKTEDQ